MGMRILSSGDSYKDYPTDPNPNNFKIIKTEQVNSWLVAVVKYQNCTNYEGNKILVFDGVKEITLRNCNYLDPHFTKGSLLSPFARFEPTVTGWNSAIMLCRNLNKAL